VLIINIFYASALAQASQLQEPSLTTALAIDSFPIHQHRQAMLVDREPPACGPRSERAEKAGKRKAVPYASHGSAYSGHCERQIRLI
jgi:hypothetical protein